ncbi:DUF2971 domain-containing protein [Micavibrio aeruginosavorus]|uniref:DUF2971 domain-containing protein n=1 Tax=Micavibrio aeruginosavorus TaxID=349221 RepID=UPI003F4AA80E
MQTAAELKIGSLYSYQPYIFEYLKQTVLSNLIFLSNPVGFNDPWDCRPHFFSDVDDPEIRKAVISYYTTAYKKARPNGQINIEDAISQLDKDPEKLKGFMKKFSDGLFEDICSQYRVRCLTTKNDNALMWGHYAAKHTGLCLEFDVKNPVFCAALKVEYNKDYPPFQLTDDSAEANVKILTTKSNHWAYEDEFRLIALENTTKLPADQMLIVKNSLLEIPEGSLKSIILGCLMPEEYKQQIADLLKNSGKKIVLKEAARLPNKYGLEIKERA